MLREKSVLRNIGDGLVLRRSTPSDAQALIDFNARIHSDEGPEHPDERVGAWASDLMEKPHPTFHADDFTIVEDTRDDKIVSCMNLISQTWSYGGILFGVGRPELVGTLPEYRNRGLVRLQFDVIHQWSKERGEKVQAITGIPYYYRQFGYEMCINLGGGRVGYKVQVPALKDGEQEPFHVRLATQADLSFVANLYQQACGRYLVSCVWNDALWQYELIHKSEKNVNRMDLRVIEGQDGELIGYLAHPHHTWGPTMIATACELKPGVSWGTVTPSIVRYLYATGESYAKRDGKDDFGAFGFWLGSEHPLYQVLHGSLPRLRKPYAWYVRVPDLVDFLLQIVPVLEKRLEASHYSGHTGELKLTFYRNGLILAFDKGRLVKVEGWRPSPAGHSGDAAFPGLTFLQLLFGYRSFEELNSAFVDCFWDNDQVFNLLNVLFPKQASDIWPVS